jgi:TPR repeat protein
MVRLPICLALIFAFCSPHFAQGAPRVTAADYKIFAEEGDESAQYHLGIIYRDGQGVPQDYAESAKWFRKAATQKTTSSDRANGTRFFYIVTSQTALGAMSFNGWGVPKDYAEALKWFRKAAEMGEPDALFYLGNMYANGLGVPKDYAEALKWYRKGAYSGSEGACLMVGLYYALGDKGLPKDHVEAYAWCNIAATLKQQEAKRLRDGLNLTPEEKARAQKRSTELFDEIERKKFWK